MELYREGGGALNCEISGQYSEIVRPEKEHWILKL